MEKKKNRELTSNILIQSKQAVLMKDCQDIKVDKTS